MPTSVARREPSRCSGRRVTPTCTSRMESTSCSTSSPGRRATGPPCWFERFGPSGGSGRSERVEPGAPTVSFAPDRVALRSRWVSDSSTTTCRSTAETAGRAEERRLRSDLAGTGRRLRSTSAGASASPKRLSCRGASASRGAAGSRRLGRRSEAGPLKARRSAVVQSSRVAWNSFHALTTSLKIRAGIVPPSTGKPPYSVSIGVEPSA